MTDPATDSGNDDAAARPTTIILDGSLTTCDAITQCDSSAESDPNLSMILPATIFAIVCVGATSACFLVRCVEIIFRQGELQRTGYQIHEVGPGIRTEEHLARKMGNLCSCLRPH
jgi:hypothetical protein